MREEKKAMFHEFTSERPSAANLCVAAVHRNDVRCLSSSVVVCRRLYEVSGYVRRSLGEFFWKNLKKYLSCRRNLVERFSILKSEVFFLVDLGIDFGVKSGIFWMMFSMLRWVVSMSHILLERSTGMWNFEIFQEERRERGGTCSRREKFWKKSIS